MLHGNDDHGGWDKHFLRILPRHDCCSRLCWTIPVVKARYRYTAPALDLENAETGSGSRVPGPGNAEQPRIMATENIRMS